MPAPERSSAPRSWRVLGLILPRSIRDGVYEPAYLDLWRSISVAPGTDPQRPTRRFPASLTIAGYLLVAVWYALPRYFTEVPGSRRARWARRLGFAMMIAVVLLAVLPRLMRYAY